MFFQMYNSELCVHHFMSERKMTRTGTCNWIYWTKHQWTHTLKISIYKNSIEWRNCIVGKKDTLPDPKSVILGYPQIFTVFMGKVILLMVVAIYYCRTFDQWSWVVLFFIPSPFCVERISTKSPIFIKFSQKYLSKFSIIWLARSDEVWIFFFFFLV